MPAFPARGPAPVLYPHAVSIPGGLRPGGFVLGEDVVRFSSLPIAVETGGLEWDVLRPAWLFQWGRDAQGGSPVVAVDMVVHRIYGDELVGGVIAFLYANGANVRHLFNDSKGERPWAKISRGQVDHVWRKQALVR